MDTNDPETIKRYHDYSFALNSFVVRVLLLLLALRFSHCIWFFSHLWFTFAENSPRQELTLSQHFLMSFLSRNVPQNYTEVFGHWLKKTELSRICIIWFHLWIVRRICKNISRSTYHHIVVYFNEASYLLSCFVFKANALRSRSAFQWGMLMLPKQKFEDWLNQTELWYFVFIRGSYE